MHIISFSFCHICKTKGKCLEYHLCKCKSSRGKLESQVRKRHYRNYNDSSGEYVWQTNKAEFTVGGNHESFI